MSDEAKRWADEQYKKNAAKLSKGRMSSITYSLTLFIVAGFSCYKCNQCDNEIQAERKADQEKIDILCQERKAIDIELAKASKRLARCEDDHGFKDHSNRKQGFYCKETGSSNCHYNNNDKDHHCQCKAEYEEQQKVHARIYEKPKELYKYDPGSSLCK